MKRLFIMFMCLMSIMCLVGCVDINDEKKYEMVNIDFIIDGESHLIKIEKGSSISSDIIPLINKEEYAELYYDENMKNKYNNEPLNDDIKMYVKLVTNNLNEDIKISEEVIKNIKVEYVNKYLLKYNKEATIDEVYIHKYYGVYNDAYILIITNAYEDYLTIITYEFILGYRFEYPDNNQIKVFYKNSFYTLTEAYEKYKILSNEDITHIYEQFIK